MTHDELTAEAAGLLRDRYPRSGLVLDSVVVDYPGAGATLLRCRLSPRSVGGPTTIVLKRSNRGDDALPTERAALELLASTEAASLFPQLIAADADSQLLILEDLGPSEGRQLGQILNGQDPVAARDALLAVQRAFGRMHGAALGREGDFEAALQRYGVSGHTAHGVHFIDDCLRDFASLPGVAEVDLPAGLGEELAEVRRALADPAWQTLTHGDATPANALVDPDGSVRLYDLETAGWRHAMIDGSYASLRYLHSVWAREIPAEVRAAAKAAYREALVAGLPAAADLEVFERVAAVGALGWLARLCSKIESVLEADVRWGRSTWRQRIVTALDRGAELAPPAGLPALGESSRRVAEHMRHQWPPEDCRLPLHPAFHRDA